MFSDSENERLFVIDYEQEVVKVIDTQSGKICMILDEASYPVYCSFSTKYIIVSDFWGHKIDFYNRDDMTFSHSIETKKGPAFSIVNGDLLYFVSHREYFLQVLDIQRRGVFQEFELTGRVPKFYFYDSLVILPYYDNYHTWSRDYELEDSVGIINISSLFQWNIEGLVKKPLNVLRLDEGHYVISGYLDHGIYEITWGSMEARLLIEWSGHSHIMDMELFGDCILVGSMSEEELLIYDYKKNKLQRAPSAKGILDIDHYDDKYIFLLSNFDEKLQVLSSDFSLIGEYPVGQYPIKMLIEKDYCYVLSMDSAEITVFKIDGD